MARGFLDLHIFRVIVLGLDGVPEQVQVLGLIP